MHRIICIKHLSLMAIPEMMTTVAFGSLQLDSLAQIVIVNTNCTPIAHHSEEGFIVTYVNNELCVTKSIYPTNGCDFCLFGYDLFDIFTSITALGRCAKACGLLSPNG